MTTIEVYPSNLPGQPLERHQVPDSGTLHDWLTASCPSYKPGPLQPICAFAGGVLLPPDSWASVRLAGQTLELRPNPQDFGISLWLLGGLLLGAVAVMVLLKPNIPSMKSSRRGTGAGIERGGPEGKPATVERGDPRSVWSIQGVPRLSVPASQVFQGHQDAGSGRHALHRAGGIHHQRRRDLYW